MRDLMFGAAVLVAAAASPACSKKVTADECEKFADHMVEMTLKETGAHVPPGATPGTMEGILKNALQAQRGQFVQQCTSGMPRAAYDCMMRATSVTAIQAECRGKY
jgi:hypothetical protein